MEEKNLRLHPRRLARKMAKRQLDRRGATGYNKPGKFGNTPSKFSMNWKHFAVEAMETNKKK